MDWIAIAQNKIQRRAVVHTVTKPKFLWRAEDFLTCWTSIRALEGLCQMELIN